MKMKFKKLPALIILYLYLSPFFDLATGVCIYKLGLPESFLFSPSQLLRIAFIIFSIILLKKKEFVLVYYLFLYLFTLEILSFFFIQNFAGLLSGMNYFMKIIFIVLLYFSVTRLEKVDRCYIPKILNVFLNSASLYALGIIVPSLLGISISSYSEGTFGQKGLYASGNSLGIYLGSALCLAVFVKQKTTFGTIRFLLLLTSIIFLGTKTAFIFIIVSFILYLRIKITNSGLLICLIIGGILFCYHRDLLDILSSVYDVVIFRFKNSDDLLTFVTSGRNLYVFDAFNQLFQSDFWFLRLLFGSGAFLSFRTQYEKGMSFDTLETDLFDILFMYGLIGCVCYISIMVYCIKKCVGISKNISILFMLYFLHSILAGHVLFDGLPVIVGIMLLLVIRNGETMKKFYTI